MKKIDLNSTVKDWCEQARQEYRMSVRLVNCLLHKGIEDITMRQFCQMSVAQVNNIGALGDRTMTELVHLLARHGLTLEMTRAEFREYEGKEERKPNNIDWERRTWEAALRFATATHFNNVGKYGFPTPYDSVERARDLVDAYRKSLKGEL